MNQDQTEHQQPLDPRRPRPRKPPGKQGLYDPAHEKDSCGVGFIAHIKGRQSHSIVDHALTMLENMSHRGACGCEANTGDGAGILTTLPHAFLGKVALRDAGLTLPKPGHYGVGIVFLPQDHHQREFCQRTVEQIVVQQGQIVLGWRDVPRDNSMIGQTALDNEPAMKMLFLAAPEGEDVEALERQLYTIRKLATFKLRNSDIEQANFFYFPSLSTKVLIYKGQLTSHQLRQYFTDLHDPDFVSHLGMVHSRFSTNTFPSWDRAQPMRFMCHNGEINTLRGNINYMHARESLFQSKLFGKEIHKIFPVCEPDTSDSGTFDNCLEMLLHTGRSLPHAVMMMIPEAWQNHDAMDPQRRAFYEFHSCLMEPWDGPASVAFTDGHYIGAVLDRNGLRPSRYYLTKDDHVIMSSEVGALPVDPKNVLVKGRLQPGRMFLVDFQQGRIIDDQELKTHLSHEHPYQQWMQEQRITFADLPEPTQVPGLEESTVLTRKQSFGYTHEEVHKLLIPMGVDGYEATGSMGNDAALACLSDQPRMMYDYFKQLFAQVTNPPIDSIREELVMTLECYIGPERNLLEATPQHAHRLLVSQPILTNEELAKFKDLNHRGWRSKVIDILFQRHAHGGSAQALQNALDRISREASQAIREGYSLVILSDRGVSADYVPIPALLACGAVHHHLIREGTRTRIGIVLETGEAREVHHHCLLVGYGADAVNPYLAFETLWDLTRDNTLDGRKFTDEKLVKHYIKAVGKGLLKVMSKMGISTLQSYKGAQIFEAVGLNCQVIDHCFTATSSRVEGVGFDVLAMEAIHRHEIGFPMRKEAARLPVLPSGGQYQWRDDGERHMYNPLTIAQLQEATNTNSREAYERFTEMIDKQSQQLCTLRGLFKLKAAAQPVPIEEVEPAREIVKRFCTGAMSLGSISPEAHETLAIAMNRIGGKSNTGEGGEDPRRFKKDANGDWRRSAIKQVASARFGVTSNYLTNAEELQIKMAQGAKPGEGGQLPGHKVDKYIAWLRHSTPGVTLISPPPHHDIYSIEDLAQLIHDLKNANPSARISVKLVAEVGVGTVAAGVAKAHADHILIAGHDGGTGASPLTSIKHAGAPWELGLAETHQTLVLNDLRSRVVVQTDGQLKTGRDVTIAALLGAEEFGFSTAPLITLGCIMMRACHLNTCPVGIATQDPVLRKKFAGKPESAINFFFLLAEQVRRYMAQLGFRKLTDMIGRVDMLEVSGAIKHWKAQGLDLTPILMPATKPNPGVQIYCVQKQDHGLEHALDNELIRLAQPALERKERVRIDRPIRNVNRTVGTMLSHEISKRYNEEGLPEDTIHINLTGSAGQSFGAWLARGVTLELEGDANDYVGKGLSGGRVIVYPPRDAVNAGYVPEKNIIIGNVALYGATSGHAFFRGIVGERFCVRNSGATAVVEGVGDHGCEYMTNGRAVILGPTGRNFAAGMSGGLAYVYDPNDEFLTRCNLGMVELEKVETEADATELRRIIELHQELTGSTVARTILEDWTRAAAKFHKVIPSEYKRALAEIEEEKHMASASTDGEAIDLPGGVVIPRE
jgi:glutamate synthase (NADPH/NADH) large chain